MQNTNTKYIQATVAFLFTFAVVVALLPETANSENINNLDVSKSFVSKL